MAGLDRNVLQLEGAGLLGHPAAAGDRHGHPLGTGTLWQIKRYVRLRLVEARRAHHLAGAGVVGEVTEAAAMGECIAQRYCPAPRPRTSWRSARSFSDPR